MAGIERNGRAQTRRLLATALVAVLASAMAVTPASSDATAASAPGAPLALSGTLTVVTGTRTVRLAWSPPAGGAESYRVATTTLGGEACDPSAPGATTATTTTVHVPIAFAPSTRQWYCVSGVAAGVVGAPAVVGPFLAPTLPSTVVGLTSSVTAERALTLAWSAPASSGALPTTSYRVVSTTTGPGSCTSDATTVTVVASAAATVTAVLADRPAGVATWYCVIPSSAAGAGAAASTDRITLTARPRVPGGVSAVAGVGSLAVSWAPPIDTGGRPLIGSRVAVVPHATTCDTSASPLVTGTTLTVADLLPGAPVDVCVAAVNDLGTGPAALAGPYTPDAPPPTTTTTTTAPPTTTTTTEPPTTTTSTTEPPTTTTAPPTTTTTTEPTTTTTSTTEPPTTTTAPPTTTTTTEPTTTTTTTTEPPTTTTSTTTSTTTTSVPPTTAPAMPTEPAIRTIAPRRVVDTRDGTGVPGRGAGRAEAGTPVRIPVGATTPATPAVLLRLTVLDADAAGFLAVHPCGAAAATSALNHPAGEWTTGLVLAPIDAAAGACVTPSATAHVVVDVVGITTARYRPSHAQRLVDTRSARPLERGATRRIPLPDGSGHAVTVTATRAASAGYLSAWDCADPVPESSVLNVGAGVDAANLVVVRGRELCLRASTAVDVIVDDLGTVDGVVAGARRVADTRGDGREPVTPAAPFTVVLDLPRSARTAILTVTATRTTGRGTLVVDTCGGDAAPVTRLAVRPGQDVATTVVVGAASAVCVELNAGSTDVVVDVMAALA